MNLDKSGTQTQAAPVLDLTSEEQDNILAEVEKISDEKRQAIADYIQQLRENDNWKKEVNKKAIDLNKRTPRLCPF